MNEYAKTQKPDENFVITEWFARRAAYPLAEWFRRAGFSAHVVSILAGVAWMASVATVLSGGWVLAVGAPAGGWLLLVLTAVLWNLGYLLDVADGSLARMTGRAGAPGFFLDFVFHLLFQPMFLCSIGVMLFMVTDRPAYLLLALFSIGSNWGPTFSAKEHVLCEQIAKGECDPQRLAPDDRYQIFIDSPRTKATAAHKRETGAWGMNLALEFFCFPGQFMLMGAMVLLDTILSPWLGPALVFTKTAFVLIAVVMIVRIPFRIRREFLTMALYDALRRPPLAKPDPAPSSGLRADEEPEF